MRVRPHRCDDANGRFHGWWKRWHLVLVMVALTCNLAIPASAAAQQSADVIRGQVVGPDSQPLADVMVTALSFVGGIQKQKRTDKNGRYTITFPNGEGRYWLQFNSIGLVSRRIDVRRRSDEDVLMANITLSRSQELGEVRVTAAPRMTQSRNDNAQDISNTNRSITTGFVTVAPELRGDLAAQAAMLPGVQLIPGVDGAPDQFSIFGLSGDQNNITLNGLQNGASKLPREASTSLQLRTGYDVSSGGASGATIAINTVSGTNQIVRPLSFVLSPAQAQVSGIGGADSRSNSISVSTRASGPWKWDRSFYNAAFQFDHREQPLADLTSSSRNTLASSGISADSLVSLSRALDTFGIAYNRTNARTSSDEVRYLGSFDWAPNSATSGHALTLTTNAGYQTRGASAFSIATAPSVLTNRKSFNAGAQLRHTNFFGAGILTESVFSVSGNHSSVQPVNRGPTATVLLTSSVGDSAVATRPFTVGGSSSGSSNDFLNAGMRNTLSRISTNNRHRTKLTSELAFMSASDEQEQNALGQFTYQSLDALRANRPSSFSRTMGTRNVQSDAVIGGLALSDSWRPTGNLQLQYGVRGDVSWFLRSPELNQQLQTDLGIRNDRVPNRVYFSPRIGFSKTILDGYAWTKGADYDYDADNSVFSGGIGLFQNVRGPSLVTGALAQSASASSLTTLDCVGDATPIPDWSSFANSSNAIPASCLTGPSAGGVSSRLPAVSAFSPNFVEPRSARASLRYYTERFHQHRTTFALSYAYNFNQPGDVDANLVRTSAFSLAGEGNRPVFVSTGNIDPASGIAPLVSSRISSRFGRVRELQSNLKSQSFTFTFNDLRLNFGEPFSIDFGYGFTYQREQFAGSTSTAGDPFAIGTSRGSIPMHQFNTTLRRKLGTFGVIALFGQVRSGMRFTPTVAGDINGDGIAWNDRAFIGTSGSAGDIESSAQIQQLIERGPASVRSCLKSQVGTIAARNSCKSGWNFGSSLLSLGINPTKIGLPARTALQFTLNNPLGAVDMLVHGSKDARGWGQTPVVDDALLYVTGFDRGRQQFRYRVNQRFGDTRGQAFLSQTPVALTVTFRVDLASGYAWQNFNQSIQRGRARTGAKMNEGALRAMGAPGGALVPLSINFLLQSSDRYDLSKMQADSLTRVVYRFNQLVDSAWTPVAKKAAALGNNFDEALLQREYNNARDVIFDYWIAVMPSIRNLYTRGQYKSMNETIRNNLFDEDYLRRLRSQNVTFNIASVP